MSDYMSKLSATLKWDPKLGRIASTIMAAYVGFFYLTKKSVPNFFYTLCSSVVFKVVLLAAFVAAVLHRDYFSAGLIAAAYFMLCNLVGRGMWEMMENMPSTNPATEPTSHTSDQSVDTQYGTTGNVPPIIPVTEPASQTPKQSFDPNRFQEINSQDGVYFDQQYGMLVTKNDLDNDYQKKNPPLVT